MGTEKQYDKKIKVQAVKLAKEAGVKQTAKEIEIPTGALYVDKESEGKISIK